MKNQGDDRLVFDIFSFLFFLLPLPLVVSLLSSSASVFLSPGALLFQTLSVRSIKGEKKKNKMKSRVRTSHLCRLR